MSYELTLGEALSGIADELNGLCEESAELKAIYSQASTDSDLTFIKIIEHRYESLTEEFIKLSDLLEELRVKLKDMMEGVSSGR
jgi:archaellum component FlaC